MAGRRMGIVAAVIAAFAMIAAATPAGSSPRDVPSKAERRLNAQAGTDLNYRIVTMSSNENPGGTDIGNHCDDCTTLITFPFPVTFYGQTYTTAYASSNGNLQFTTNNASYSSTCLPNPDFGAAIMPFSRDLRTNGENDGIFTTIGGVSGNRTFDIYWRVHYFVSSETAVFFIRFFQNSPAIEMHYNHAADQGASAVSGVQASGTGPFAQFSCNEPTLTSPSESGIPWLNVRYIPALPVTVAKAGSGTGSVVSTPAGIDCGTTCSARFDLDTTVTLHSTPASGSTFTGWSGGPCSGTDDCVVIMSEARSVTANFATPRLLSVTKVGAGTGTVTSSPPGINCGATCSAEFTEGDDVTLTAVAESGSVFAGWSSGPCSGTGQCTMDMATDQFITATFDVGETPPPPKCPGFENDPRPQFVGAAGNDKLVGTPGKDILCGLGGTDDLRGAGGNDLIIGARGSDALKGGAGRDRMMGGAGTDILIGGKGRDFANGGKQRDSCQAEVKRKCEA